MLVLKDCFCVYDGIERLYNKNVIIKDNIISAVTDSNDTSLLRMNRKLRSSTVRRTLSFRVLLIHIITSTRY